MEKLASPKKKITKTIIITLIFLLAPLTAFASASPAYMPGIENVCDLSLTDSQGDVYDEQDIEYLGLMHNSHQTHLTRIIVEPSNYTMDIDCVSNLNNGVLSIHILSYADQDGINNYNPSSDRTIIQSSMFFVSSAAGSFTLDATGELTNQLIVRWEFDADDKFGNYVESDGLISILPMVDTTNDTTPRISMWPGKVNQHNENGVWMTDSDGVSGGWSSASYPSDYGDRKLEYCQKFWPNTDSVELRPFKEEIDFWTRGNADSYTSIRDVYECVLGDDLGNNTGGDNDTGDDNNTGGDDDTGGDDNNTGGDNDTGDDNNTGGDNDTGNDDNNTGGDNDTGDDDNNTGEDNSTVEEDEQPYIPPTLDAELDTTTSPSILSLTASNLDSSKDYTIEWWIVSTATFDIVSGSEGIENSTGLQITDTWLVTDEIELESGEYCLLGTLFEDGELVETEVMDCQTVVTPEVVEDVEVEANMVEKIVTAISEFISGLLASIVESKDE